MRVGLVRNVGLSAVALLALGLAGCDDNPLEIADGVAVRITTNPTTMILPAGLTTLLESRTIDEGSRPTWEDVTAAVDGTCGAATISIAVAASFVPSVQPPGVFDVTGGTTLGTTCITLTGGGATASVAVTVVADSLEIASPADTIDVFSTVQLTAAVFSDDGSPVGPLDPADISWSSDDAAVVSVDATGLGTGNGAGSAIITATWSDAGVSVTSNDVAIAVRVPIPVLVSTDVAAADAGDLVTITGTGFLIGPHFIFVDGVEVAADVLLDPMIVDGTTATFIMPPGAPGATEVTVGSSIAPPLGGFSNGLAVTRNTDDFEPANELFGTAPPLPAFPVVIDNWMDGAAGDVDDFWAWAPAAGVTLDLGLSWVGSSGDLDLLFHTGQPPGNYVGCFPLATGNVPEAGQCTFVPGTYIVRVNDFAAASELTRYTLTMTVVP